MSIWIRQITHDGELMQAMRTGDDADVRIKLIKLFNQLGFKTEESKNKRFKKLLIDENYKNSHPFYTKAPVAINFFAQEKKCAERRDHVCSKGYLGYFV